MFKIVLIVILSVSVFYVQCNTKPSTAAMLLSRPTRIIGGKDAEKGGHPWQMSIHWGNRQRGIRPRHICGGSLLTAGWVLTAGHCVISSPRKNFTGEFVVLAGKYRLGVVEETEQSRMVVESFVYPDYNGTVAPYDIALMKLENPFELNPYVSTVMLPIPEAIPKGKAMLTGWGSVGRTRAPKSPPVLQAAVLEIIDYDICKKAIDKALKRRENSPLDPTNICTGPLDGTLSACKGDSGGPLIVTNTFEMAEIVGIVSWGLFPCGHHNAPSVYTRVSAYIPWIHQILLNH